MRITVDQLTVTFPQRAVTALDSVDLTVDPGEHVALLGSSGSGKTTLLRTLLGAVRPVSGRIRVGGMNPFGSRDEIARLRGATGVVRQGNDLVLGLSARVNAVMATVPSWGAADWVAVLRGNAPLRYQDRLHALAERHDVSGCLGARVEHLSGGQRQRVALIRALLPRPGLLLADEPTVGLDPVTAEVAVTALQGVEAATVIVATHDLGVAQRFSRIVALRGGRLVFDGPSLSAAQGASIYERSTM